MILGVVESAAVSGKRILLRVRVDDVVYTDVVLVQPLHLWSRVVEGERVFLGQVDGEDVTYFAWPMRFSTDAQDVVLKRDDGFEIRLNGNGGVEITCEPGAKVTLSDGAGASALATKADIDALISSFNAAIAVQNAHVHPAGTPNTGPPVGLATPASPAVGTVVVEAK